MIYSLLMKILVNLFYFVFSLESATDYLMHNPVSSTLSLRQASGGNPGPLALADPQLTPSTSIAPDFSLSSRPSSSNSEQDKMLMRATALSLGENISEPASALDSTSESNSSTEPQQQPNVLEAEKDAPNNPR